MGTRSVTRAVRCTRAGAPASPRAAGRRLPRPVASAPRGCDRGPRRARAGVSRPAIARRDTGAAALRVTPDVEHDTASSRPGEGGDRRRRVLAAPAVASASRRCDAGAARSGGAGTRPVDSRGRVPLLAEDLRDASLSPAPRDGPRRLRCRPPSRRCGASCRRVPRRRGLCAWRRRVSPHRLLCRDAGEAGRSRLEGAARLVAIAAAGRDGYGALELAIATRSAAPLGVRPVATTNVRRRRVVIARGGIVRSF
jgi:hypothetical protein